jgi:GNAT superfamily N-acetyltransferase
VRRGDDLVAVSSWVPRPHPDHPALAGVQVRGMATAHDLQGTGLGGVLLEAGVQRAVAGGADVVWARARDTALAFYERHGFEVHGRGYVDLTTQLPHHDVIRRA